MSSLVISGDTSGSVTLQAPAVAGSAILTLPATSGTVITSASGTAATATNLAGGSNGTIPYQSASGTTQMLAVGTSGQVLQTNGAGAPSWVTPSAGAMTLISTVTASSTANVTFTGLTTAYSAYVVILNHVCPATNNSPLKMFISTDNGATFISTSYEHEYLVLYNAAYNNNRSYGNDAFYWPNTGSSATSGGANITMTFHPSSTATAFGFYYSAFWYDDYAYGYTPIFGGGSRGGAGNVNAIKLAFQSGNIASGTFNLYGIT